MNIHAMLAQNPLAYIKQGFRFEPSANEYHCLFCEQSFVQGRIYPAGDGLMDAPTAMKTHLLQQHGGSFHALLELPKKGTGLTELQTDLLRRFYAGQTDAHIAQSVGTASLSTLRNQRFALRERAKQAKIFLAIMELLEERLSAGALAPEVPLPPIPPRPFMPRKQAEKRALLTAAAAQFQPGRRYPKTETDLLLQTLCADHVELRRCLVDFGYLARDPGGAFYWRTCDDNPEHSIVDRKQRIFEYKNTPKPAGVFQIRNTANGKILLGVSLNLTGRANRFEMERKTGNIANNPRIRQDWEQYGPACFVFEILEQLPVCDDPQHDYRPELEVLERKWLQTLMPYQDRGYNPLPPTQV